jgi:hypothetical protein
MYNVTLMAVEKQKVLHILSVCLQPWVSITQFAYITVSLVAYPALRYFSTLTHKRKDFGEKKLLDCSVSSTIFTCNISQSKKK